MSPRTVVSQALYSSDSARKLFECYWIASRALTNASTDCNNFCRACRFLIRSNSRTSLMTSGLRMGSLAKFVVVRVFFRRPRFNALVGNPSKKKDTGTLSAPLNSYSTLALTRFRPFSYF